MRLENQKYSVLFCVLRQKFFVVHKKLINSLCQKILIYLEGDDKNNSDLFGENVRFTFLPTRS